MKNPTLPRSILATLALCTGLTSVHAASVQYNISANGAKELAGGAGTADSDGTAIGTLTLDNGTGGTTGFAMLNITIANLDTPLTGWHVHTGIATTTGTILLNFGNPETIRSGNSLVTTVTGLSSTSIDSVFANPSGFYFNLHNTSFTGGAVRDQLVPVPEPGQFVLLGLGGVALALSGKLRRKARA
jgi:hypothetical protein